MTLSEAVAAFEADFTVSDTAGCPIEGTPRLDMSLAPTGDAYVIIASAGEISMGDVMPGWFATEELAARAWLREAWAYAESQGGKTLYWREEPTLRQQEFVALDQAALMSDPLMRRSITLNVATVVARLFVSKPTSEEKISDAEVVEDGRANLPPVQLGRGKSKRH